MKTAVNPNSSVYYSGTFWNDYQRVQEYMCENFTGAKTKWWVQDFLERFAREPFQHGLFLNCGNGWVEREFIDKQIVKKATAFDYSRNLLSLAREEKGTRPITYFQTDVNRVVFKEDCFDLVVNVAALHHVQFINRLCRVLCRSLKSEGLFVSFDYVGPHRNQYSLVNWILINLVNRSVTPQVRKSPLVRPHLPTMIYTDPTEAIHSELTFKTMAQYFDIRERHDTGGGIAYEILTHNPKIKMIPINDLNPQIDKILRMDRFFSRWKIVPPLFSYFIAAPRKAVLRDTEKMTFRQRAENRREVWASRHGGTYTYQEFWLAVILKRLYPRLKQLSRHLKKW